MSSKTPVSIAKGQLSELLVKKLNLPNKGSKPFHIITEGGANEKAYTLAVHFTDQAQKEFVYKNLSYFEKNLNCEGNNGGAKNIVKFSSQNWVSDPQTNQQSGGSQLQPAGPGNEPAPEEENVMTPETVITSELEVVITKEEEEGSSLAQENEQDDGAGIQNQGSDPNPGENGTTTSPEGVQASGEGSQKFLNVELVPKKLVEELLIAALKNAPSFRLTPGKITKQFLDELKSHGIGFYKTSGPIQMNGDQFVLPTLKTKDIEPIFEKLFKKMIGEPDDIKKEEEE